MPFPGFHPGILFHHQNSPKPEQMKMMKKWNQMEQSKRISADLCWRHCQSSNVLLAMAPPNHHVLRTFESHPLVLRCSVRSNGDPQRTSIGPCRTNGKDLGLPRIPWISTRNQLHSTTILTSINMLNIMNFKWTSGQGQVKSASICLVWRVYGNAWQHRNAHEFQPEMCSLRDPQYSTTNRPRLVAPKCITVLLCIAYICYISIHIQYLMKSIFYHLFMAKISNCSSKDSVRPIGQSDPRSALTPLERLAVIPGIFETHRRSEMSVKSVKAVIQMLEPYLRCSGGVKGFIWFHRIMCIHDIYKWWNVYMFLYIHMRIWLYMYTLFVENWL